MARRKRVCKKRNTFATKSQALRESWKVPPKLSGIIPVRAYWCRQHKGYHYTSRIPW